MSDELSASCRVPHAVIFVYDPSMLIDVPEDTGAGPVLATPNCISLWTADEDSGPTTLFLSADHNHQGCALRFSGQILTTGQLAFNTSDCTPVIETTVPEGAVDVAIYSNDATNPSKVVCVIEAKPPVDA